MNNTNERVAWGAVPSEAEVRCGMPIGARHPYDFGLLPALSEILFGPGHLARYEREMIAAGAAAAQDCRN